MNTEKEVEGMLLSLLGTKDMIEKWWDSPNKAFAKMTPRQMLEKDSQAVVEYIYLCAHGGW